MNNSSFISIYQEPAKQQRYSSEFNQPDLGTQTKTDSREQSDQDPQNLGTKTSTQTRENDDADISCYVSFSIIPRDL